jgi:hypothetical protein
MVWLRVLRVLNPRVRALEKPSRKYTDKLQTRTLASEGAPREEIRKYLKIYSMKLKKYKRFEDGA